MQRRLARLGIALICSPGSQHVRLPALADWPSCLLLAVACSWQMQYQQQQGPWSEASADIQVPPCAPAPSC